MDCIQALTTRRGVLRYDARPVGPELIEQVLAAAIAAPSPANLQPWAFVVVTEPELARRTARYLLDVQDRGVFQAFLGLRPQETGRYIGLYDLFENAPCFIVPLRSATTVFMNTHAKECLLRSAELDTPARVALVDELFALLAATK